MDSRISAVVLAVAIAGGGYAGWKFYSQLGHLRIEVANAKQELEQAKLQAAKATEKATAVQKELDEARIQETSLRAERDSARVLQQSAMRQSERLGEELQLAQRQVEYLRARAGVPASQMMPRTVQQQPMIIQALPAPRPQSAATRAPVPGQGYGPVQGQPAYPSSGR